MVKLLPLLPRPRSVTTIGSGVMLCVGSRMVNPVIMVRALHLPRGILTTQVNSYFLFRSIEFSK